MLHQAQRLEICRVTERGHKLATALDSGRLEAFTSRACFARKCSASAASMVNSVVSFRAHEHLKLRYNDETVHIYSADFIE